MSCLVVSLIVSLLTPSLCITLSSLLRQVWSKTSKVAKHEPNFMTIYFLIILYLFTLSLNCTNKREENYMVFDGKPSISMPPPEKFIFRNCYLWPWPLNPWPRKSHQCHVDLVLSNCNRVSLKYVHSILETDEKMLLKCVFDHVVSVYDTDLWSFDLRF